MDAIKSFFTTILYQPLFNALIFLAWLIPGHSIGWAIIVLTIIIRLALLPSSIRVLEHQARMRALQPKLNALKDSHGHDRAAHSKAIMELYAAEKVSPFASCLPTLIQIPVFLVLYQVFIHGLSTDQFNLLYSFTPHLDTINTAWFGLDLTKAEPYVMPIIAAGLQFLVARQTQQLMPVPAAPSKGGKGGAEDMGQMMSKQMLLIAPVMTYFITLRVPAALGLYWIATTLFMFLQQAWFLRRPLPKISNSVKTKGDVTVTIRTKGGKDE